MHSYSDRVVYNGGASFSILPDVNGGKLPFGTTPSVKNTTHFIANNAAPVSVTNFLYGANYQGIVILGDGQTTVVHGATIKTNTGANKLLAVEKVYRFTYFDGVWYEDA